MADRNNNNTKNTQDPKGPVKSINVPDKSAKVSAAADNTSKAGTKGASSQNSAPKTPSNLTSKTSTTKPDASGKGGKHKPKPPAKKSEDHEMSQRMDKIEKMIEAQAKLSRDFQHNILSAMMDSNDEESEFGTQSQSGAVSLPADHPVSDDDGNDSTVDAIDALLASDTDGSKASTSSANKHDKVLASPPVEDGQKDLEKTDSDDKADKGFAELFAADSDVGGKIRDDIAKTLKFAMIEKLEDKKIQETITKHK